MQRVFKRLRGPRTELLSPFGIAILQHLDRLFELLILLRARLLAFIRGHTLLVLVGKSSILLGIGNQYIWRNGRVLDGFATGRVVLGHG